MKDLEGVSRARNLTRAGIATIALALMTSACADVSDDDIEPEPTSEDEVVALTAEDGDWIRLDGIVETAGPSTFELDYGDGSITVEADDWDLTQEGLAIVPGDRVSVTGRMDRDVFADSAIEASAIYVKNLDTVYYANATDEEEFGLAAIPTRPVTEGVDYTGWVTGSSPNGFTLGAQTTLIQVDTSGISTPLARSGVTAGDRVYVWGDLELSSEGESKLVAEGLVELIDGGTKAKSDATPSPSPTGQTS